MQLAGTILLAAWGMLLASPAVVAAAAMAGVFSAGLAAWNEDNDLARRFGDDWHRYRGAVRCWIPRWRPAVAEPAVVYVAASCEPCSQVGGFITGRHPERLDVIPAESCSMDLRRITYAQAAGTGKCSTGIAAIGRSLEHVNLAWAAASWVARLPGIQAVLQLVTDAVGGEPRSIAGVTAPAASPDRR